MSYFPLKIQQLERKMAKYNEAVKQGVPSIGWLRLIRECLGISMKQLGEKMGKTKQSVYALEKREVEKSVTLELLEQAAEAMDMNFVYGFVPKDGSLDALIERKAREMATRIVNRASHTMLLEDQGISNERIAMSIEERTILLKYEMPKSLWD
jgi:predicted DNA-binding mobile mystery protein A